MLEPRHRVSAHAAGRLAGRDRHLAELERLMDVGLAGRGQLAGLTGAAGTGKSALVAAARHRWQQRGGICLSARCSSIHRHRPLAPILAALPELGDVAAIEPPEPALVLAALEEHLAPAPLLLLVEDVEHADELTLRLIRSAVTRFRERRFLCLVTYGVAPPPRLLREALEHELPIGNLCLRDGAALVGRLLGGEVASDALASFLWQRTAGNPHWLSELAGHLQTRGLLLCGRPTIEPAVPVNELAGAVPSSLAQVTLARLEPLDRSERRLLCAAAVIGSQFEPALLSAVLAPEEEREQVATRLAALLARGHLSGDPAGLLGFPGELTRRAVHDSCPAAEQRQLHRRIAGALEQVHGGDPPGLAAARIAGHLAAAGEAGAAAALYTRAIAAASAHGLDHDVTALCERLREVEAAAGPGAPPEHVDLLLLHLESQVRTGAPWCAPEQYQALARHWAELDLETRARADLAAGIAEWQRGRPAEAAVHLEEAFASARDLATSCHAALQLVHTSAPGSPAALTWLGRAAEIAPPGSDWPLHVELVRAELDAAAGQYDVALAHASTIREQARRAGRRQAHAHASMVVADCLLQCYSLDEALAAYLDAEPWLRAIGARRDDASTGVAIGLCHLLSGRHQAAERVLENALARASDLGDPGLEREALAHLGLAVGLARDLDEGTAMCQASFARAEEAGDLRSAHVAALHLFHLAIVAGDRPRFAALLATCERVRPARPAPLFELLLESHRRAAGTLATDAG